MSNDQHDNEQADKEFLRRFDALAALPGTTDARVFGEQRGEVTRIEAPDWKRCDYCGKTGSHTHAGAQRPMLLGDLVEDEPVLPEGFTLADLQPTFDWFDEFLTRIIAERREALKHMSADDVRAFFEGNLTVALGPDGVRCLNRIDPAHDARYQRDSDKSEGWELLVEVERRVAKNRDLAAEDEWLGKIAEQMAGNETLQAALEKT